MGDSLCLKLLVLNTSSVSIFTGTNMRTICVVTVGINMANMVAIATLIDICEQKWLPKGYLTERQAL